MVPSEKSEENSAISSLEIRDVRRVEGLINSRRIFVGRGFSWSHDPQRFPISPTDAFAPNPPHNSMTRNEKIITVFGSGRPADDHVAYHEALELGQSLATAGFVVCTGGYAGVMEAVSRGAHEAGGRVLAVTSTFFSARANRWVQEETTVATWQERLFELVRQGDGYVACKGGTGTLAELAVVWEMLNKRAMDRRPFVVLGDFWLPILNTVSEADQLYDAERGEIIAQLVHRAPTPADAVRFLAANLLVDRTN